MAIPRTLQLPVAPGPRDEAAGKALKDSSLTNLYNARPKWLSDAHAELDGAVAAAYGWPVDIAVDGALAALLALNLSRGTTRWTTRNAEHRKAARSPSRRG